VYTLRQPITTLLFTLLGVVNLNAQESTEDFTDLLEELVESLELDGDLDYNTVLEQLEGYATNPLDLNQSSLEDLSALGMLTSAHQTSLRLYIAQNGPLLSIYELQAVPGFDLAVIHRILPFVSVRGSADDVKQPLGRVLFTGRNELFLRWGTTVEDQRGFIPREDGTAPYAGDKNRLYLRYKHTSERRLSYGVTMEKDPGETFFRGSNQQGFDYYSAHFFLKGYRQWLPRIAIGDYTINLGQGLILHSGFGFGKSSFVTQIKKGGYSLRPFSSVNEYDFQRGMAAVIRPSDNLKITTFVSSKKRDANAQSDTLELVGPDLFVSNSFSSLQTSGLHRTDSEIADKRQIHHTVVGSSIQYSHGRLQIGMNVVYQKFSQPFIRSDELYNTFRFAGSELSNVSLDYTYLWRNLHFFGETAWSDNGAIATINGLLISLHRMADMAILTRFLPRNFHTVSPKTFGETSAGANENGIYFGLEVRPLPEWTISAYADIWRHPWLRFNVDAPSTGNEQFMRITYRKKRKHEIYVQYKNEIKGRNLSNNETPSDIVVPHRKRSLRLHFNNKLDNGIELRNRIELSFYKEGEREETEGYLIYQDVIYRSINSPFSFTARVAFFDTEGFNSRIYAFENDLINQFYIPAYADRGLRYYVNLKYKGIRHVTLEFRVAQTQYNNRTTLSSSNSLIEGNKRTDLKAQVKWVF